MPLVNGCILIISIVKRIYLYQRYICILYILSRRCIRYSLGQKTSDTQLWTYLIFGVNNVYFIPLVKEILLLQTTYMVKDAYLSLVKEIYRRTYIITLVIILLVIIIYPLHKEMHLIMLPKDIYYLVQLYTLISQGQQDLSFVINT